MVQYIKKAVKSLSIVFSISYSANQNLFLIQPKQPASSKRNLKMSTSVI